MADTMTKGEREELKTLAKQRARVAKAGIDQRQAEMLAEVEEQLTVIYKPTDEAWAAITAAAKEAVDRADALVADECARRGIDPDLRPSLSLSWYGRGDNADKVRRAELRKLAERRLAAEARAAKQRVEEATLDVLERLTTAALTTSEARDFFDRMPTLANLPAVDVLELEGQL